MCHDRKSTDSASPSRLDDGSKAHLCSVNSIVITRVPVGSAILLSSCESCFAKALFLAHVDKHLNSP